MTDQQVWSAAVERVKADYSSLPQAVKEKLSELSAEFATLKEMHQQVVSQLDAATLCADCRGLCCRFGKHHFSIVDLIVYLSVSRELFTPDFTHPVCPYHNGAGCLMEPAFRPFNCIIFICDELEGQMGEEVKAKLLMIEMRLRDISATFDNLLGNRFANGLLITFKRALDAGTPLFNV